MRILVLACVALAACAPPAEDDIAWIPDANEFCADTFLDIAAPREGLHYDASLNVTLDVVPPDPTGQIWIDLTDNLGTSYTMTSSTVAHSPNDRGLFPDTWHYDLAPGRRYTLTASTCCDGICADRRDPQQVVFFTSAP